MILKNHRGESTTGNDPVVSEKSKFQFLYINNLGPRSRNDLDLQYTLILIY